MILVLSSTEITNKEKATELAEEILMLPVSAGCAVAKHEKFFSVALWLYLYL